MMSMLGEGEEHGFLEVRRAEKEKARESEKIHVTIRVRPLNDNEISRDDVSDWECINDSTLLFKNSLFPTAYTFDKVLGPEASTHDVYEKGVKNAVLSTLRGINATIFAYGQTGSGKTYTMNGIMEYAMGDIFRYINQHPEQDFFLRFSAVEIYNEDLRDLLSKECTSLRILDDHEKGTMVEGVTEVCVNDIDHLQKLLNLCQARRRIGETSLNDTCSRSHQIVKMTIESSIRHLVSKDTTTSLVANLNLVDLGGSERTSQAFLTGTRMKEGCNINRSLFTLGLVIRKLSDTKARNSHIPYRDSKLTRLLQNALGGNAKTWMICTMSPARSNVDQSKYTLLFASFAKDVSTSGCVNVVMSDKALVKRLQKEVERLENELQDPGNSVSSYHLKALLEQRELHIKKLEEDLRNITRQKDTTQNYVEELQQKIAKIEEYGGSDPINHEDSSIPRLCACEEECPLYNVLRAHINDKNSAIPKLCSCEGGCPLYSILDTRNRNHLQNFEHNSEVNQVFCQPSTSETYESNYDRCSSGHSHNITQNTPKELNVEPLADKKSRKAHRTWHSDCFTERGNSFIRELSSQLSFRSIQERANSGTEESNAFSRRRYYSLSTLSGGGGKRGKAVSEQNSDGINHGMQCGSNELQTNGTGYGDWESGLKHAEEDHVTDGQYSDQNSDEEEDNDDDETTNSNDSDDEDGSMGERSETIRTSLTSIPGVESIKDLMENPLLLGQEIMKLDNFERKICTDAKKALAALKKEVKYLHIAERSRNGDSSLAFVSNEIDNSISSNNKSLDEVELNEDMDGLNDSKDIDETIVAIEEELANVLNALKNLDISISCKPTLSIKHRKHKRNTNTKQNMSCIEDVMVRYPSYRNSGGDALVQNLGNPSPGNLVKKDEERRKKRIYFQSESFDPDYAPWQDSIKEDEISPSNDESNANNEFRVAAEENINCIRAYVSQLKERVAKIKYMKELLSCQMENLEADSDEENEKNNVTEVKPPRRSTRLIPPSQWPLEFELLRREIIEFWDACCVSLIHRTQFFLLFQGDPSDAIYMEVELRRLTVLKNNICDETSNTSDDGDYILTLAESARALKHEREMLAKAMDKKLTNKEREEIFRKWRIPLNAKQRKLHLAHKIWTDTKDMVHIQDSVEFVTRLVPELAEASKEMMFEFSFAPLQNQTMQSSWNKIYSYLMG